MSLHTCDMCFSDLLRLCAPATERRTWSANNLAGLIWIAVWGWRFQRGMIIRPYATVQQFTKDPETHLASCYDISTSAVWVASAYFKLCSRDWNLPCPVQTAKLSNYVTLYTVPKSKWNCAERLNHATVKSMKQQKIKETTAAVQWDNHATTR